ncbi:TPA: hypothetical protein VUV35_001984 [Streptococcus pneumoniae]|nr:hypothetical protein [Streptococcus pneumoniae]
MKFVVYRVLDNIIQISKPCTLCGNGQNVQLFAGLMLCRSCQENIKLTNPGMFAANDEIEQKAQD